MSQPKKLAPIPMPLAQRWKIIQFQFLPIAIFGVAALASVLVWQDTVTTPSLLGEVEVVHAEARASQPGTLTHLSVALMQSVEAGQTIGRVRVASPEVVTAKLDVIRGEIAALRSSMGPAVDAQRVFLEASRLQLAWMDARVTLAGLRAQLQLAEDDLSYQTRLHNSGVTTDQAYRSAITVHEGLIAQIEAQETALGKLNPVLDSSLHQEVFASARNADAALVDAIRLQEQRLHLAELELQPVPLLAPMDGVVSGLTRRAGENLLAGDPVAIITAAQASRVVGFARQPLGTEPTPGMTVDIRTRRSQRETAVATVVEVAPMLETIPATLLATLRITTPEQGRRIHFTVPPELALLPGEQVDVILR